MVPAPRLADTRADGYSCRPSTCLVWWTGLPSTGRVPRRDWSAVEIFDGSSTNRHAPLATLYWIARMGPAWMSEVAGPRRYLGRPAFLPTSVSLSRLAHSCAPQSPTRCPPATPSLAPHLCLRSATLCRRGVVGCSTRRSDRHAQATPRPINKTVVMCRRERTRYTRCGHCYTYTRTCCPLPDFTQPGCKDPVTRKETVHDEVNLCVGCAIDNLIAGTKE